MSANKRESCPHHLVKSLNIICEPQGTSERFKAERAVVRLLEGTEEGQRDGWRLWIMPAIHESLS